MADFLLLAFLILLAGLVAVPVATRLGLGSVLGYLLAGMAIAPLLGALKVDVDALQVFAEFGVVMMLFIVGLELEPMRLWGMRGRLLGTGGGQVLLTTLALAAVALASGNRWQTSLAIGMVLALSSTAIVVQSLSEKGLLRSDGGEAAFSVLLFQDVAVIPILAILPLLALPELAVITRPGAESRRGEVASMVAALAPHRPLARIEAPATLDGGDVLALGRTLCVGLSQRTNAEGVRQLRECAAPLGYAVEAIPVAGALHLQTAVTCADERTLVVNPSWVDARRFASAGWEILEVDAREPFAANVLRVRGTTLCAAAFPRTNERLRARGIAVVEVAADELAKAEGGVTCCALLVEIS